MFSFALESMNETSALESFWGEALEADLPATTGNTSLTTTGRGDDVAAAGKIKLSDRIKAGFKSIREKLAKLWNWIKTKISAAVKNAMSRVTTIKVSRNKLAAYNKMQTSGMSFFKMLNRMVGQVGNAVAGSGHGEFDISGFGEAYKAYYSDAEAFDKEPGAVNDKNAHPTQYKFNRELAISQAMDTTLSTNIKALDKVIGASSVNATSLSFFQELMKKCASSISRMISATTWMLSQGSKNAAIGSGNGNTALATT